MAASEYLSRTQHAQFIRGMALFGYAPYMQDVINMLIRSAFVAVVAAVGLRVGPVALAREVRRPRLLLKILAVTGLVVPLLTAGIVKLLHVPMLLGGVLLLASVTRGSPMALRATMRRKGSLPLASTIMSILILAMPLIVPCWLFVFRNWFGLNHLTVAPIRIFFAVAPLTILPLAVGVAVHAASPKAAEFLQRVLDIYSGTAILLIAALFLWPALKTLLTFNLASWVAMIGVMSLSLAIGYATCGETPAERITVALAATKCNVTALIVIADVSYPEIHVFETVLAYIIVSILTGALWQKLLSLGCGR